MFCNRQLTCRVYDFLANCIVNLWSATGAACILAFTNADNYSRSALVRLPPPRPLVTSFCPPPKFAPIPLSHASPHPTPFPITKTTRMYGSSCYDKWSLLCGNSRTRNLRKKRNITHENGKWNFERMNRQNQTPRWNKYAREETRICSNRLDGDNDDANRFVSFSNLASSHSKKQKDLGSQQCVHCQLFICGLVGRFISATAPTPTPPALLHKTSFR